jgi:GNAT superfamily N-acetyltransferase
MSARAPVGRDLLVRPYRAEDEPEVLELVRGSLGGGPAGERTPEFFRWKHVENPFGRSYMIVAESDHRIIGLRALMRWRFQVGSRRVEAVRPVDTVTHPDYRGRGVFSMLTRTALDSLKGDVDLVFNTPNLDSLPGYLKMGWQVVGHLPVSVRICRPLRSITRVLGRRPFGDLPSSRPRIAAPTAEEVLTREPGLIRLIEQSEVAANAFSTPIDFNFLRWRFADAPLLGYHAVRQHDRNGELAGVAIFRPRRQGPVWGLVISQLLVRPGDVTSARRLLIRVRRSADIGYVATLASRGSTLATARRSAASLRMRKRFTLVVNPLERDLRPDPMLISSWALSAGDAEVF